MTGRRAAAVLLGAVLLAALRPAAAHAHGLDPAALALHEREPGVYDVTWRSATARLPGTDVRPLLPARCRSVSDVEAGTTLEHVTLRWTIDCGPGGLTGEQIAIQDLAAARINALLTIAPRRGTPIQLVLAPRQPTFRVPEQPSWSALVTSYVVLGIEHILGGADHLLFVFGLLLLVPTTRRLVQTVTAFTVGHSLTLSAAVLGWAQVPSRPIEVLIAVSVLVLAVELAHDRHASLLRRWPWAMAVAFGLLHGFGFAGALAEVGLPAADVPLALLSFNVGIELGQLAFIAVLLAAGAVVRRWGPGVAGRLSIRPAVYAMGVLAAFWCFERLAEWLGAA